MEIKIVCSLVPGALNPMRMFKVHEELWRTFFSIIFKQFIRQIICHCSHNKEKIYWIYYIVSLMSYYILKILTRGNYRSANLHFC